MSPLPRVALGTIQPAADSTALVWALVGHLRHSEKQVQIFHDQARFAGGTADRMICGQTARYLDSWLMSPSLCRQSFFHGSRGGDISLVVGRYAAARGPRELQGGNLEDLCNWLDLPQLAIVDVARLADCVLPPCPAGVSGLLLDRVPEGREPYWQTLLESLWGVPVLGALPELPELRKCVAPAREGALASCELCRELGRRLARHARLPQLMRLAARQEFASHEPQLFRAGDQLAGVTVAVAYDEAINGYFPDVLDLLELRGATVRDFSPLRDEALPPRTDVVYLGCGQPQRFAGQLAGNHCMTLALRNHVRQGRRVYGEGGGMAYLCQALRLPSGQHLPMAGVLPAVAIHAPRDEPPRPTEVILDRDQWLGPAGFRLSGYLAPDWRIEPAGPLENCVAEPSPHWRLVARGQAIGSRLQLNFAAQPDFVRQFSPAGNLPLASGAR
jgi:cobyrinic acid a,c-diamide synthase